MGAVGQVYLTDFDISFSGDAVQLGGWQHGWQVTTMIIHTHWYFCGVGRSL